MCNREKKTFSCSSDVNVLLSRLTKSNRSDFQIQAYYFVPHIKNIQLSVEFHMCNYYMYFMHHDIFISF